MIAALLALLVALASPVRMTVLGDSLALGTGASDSAHGFGFLIFKRLAAGVPDSEVTNLAIGGATVPDVIRLEAPRVAAGRPNLILVSAGENDVIRGRPVQAFSADYARLLRALRKAAPLARIVVFNVADVSVSPIFGQASKAGLHERVIAYNGALEREARAAGARVVDLFEFSELARKDPGLYLSSDQFHPSDDGYSAIADRAWRTVSSR